MQTYSGTGAKSQTALLVAPMTGWYDLRLRCSAFAANGGQGLIVPIYIDGVEKMVGTSPAFQYPPGSLPFGTTAGTLAVLPAWGSGSPRGTYGEFWLVAGQTLAFSVNTGPGNQPTWTLEFSAERLGDEI